MNGYAKSYSYKQNANKRNYSKRCSKYRYPPKRKFLQTTENIYQRCTEYKTD